MCQGPSFLVTIQISPLFSFHCKLQQKSQHATDSVHGVQWTFLRRSALWESLFAGASDLVQSHVVTWTSSTWTSAHKVGPTSRPFLKMCPWLCSGSNRLLSNYRRCHHFFPYAVWQLVLWYVPVEFLYSILIVNNLRLLHNRSLDILLICKIRLICIRISKKQMLVDRSTLSSCPPSKDGSLHQQTNQVRTWFSSHIKLFLFE